MRGLGAALETHIWRMAVNVGIAALSSLRTAIERAAFENHFLPTLLELSGLYELFFVVGLGGFGHGPGLGVVNMSPPETNLRYPMGL